jgi:hypothetical protein
MKKLYRKLKGKSDDGQQDNSKSINSSQHETDWNNAKYVVDPNQAYQSQKQHHRHQQSKPVDLQSHEDVGAFAGFDTWVSSFAPAPEERIPEVHGEEIAHDVLMIKGKRHIAGGIGKWKLDR